MINHLDLFSGVGGFSLALERAIGKENIGWVGYSDIDKHANQVYKDNFPDAEELGSITDVQPEDIPERIDLITFGSPCQDFSIAGKRGGISANRSSLFFEAMRIIRAKKPTYFVFENVKGLFSSGKGEDFTIVLREIADSGYDGQWQLLNSCKHGGVPQNRERIYFVGHIRGRSRPEVFPLRQTSGESDIRNSEIASTLQHPGHSGENYRGMNMVQAADYRIDEGLRIRKDKNSPSLMSSHNSEKDLTKMPAIVIEKEKEIGVANGLKDYMVKSNSIRRLTPKECCRLQSFPDNWGEGQSDTQRYKQMGNAITVNVAEAIFRRLYL